MPTRSPSRIFLARARPARDRLDEAPTVELRPQRPRRTAAPHGDRFGDVVIDLTGPTPSAQVVAPRREQSRWRLWAPLVVVVALAVGAAALAAANYSAAVQWQDRADAAERRAVQAETASAASRRAAQEARRDRRVARQRRSRLADQLAVSEADVAALEARLNALANERAQAQDLGAVIGSAGAADRLRSLEAQVDSCIAQIAAVRSGLVADSDVDGWHRALTAAEAACGQAASDVDALAGAG